MINFQDRATHKTYVQQLTALNVDYQYFMQSLQALTASQDCNTDVNAIQNVDEIIPDIKNALDEIHKTISKIKITPNNNVKDDNSDAIHTEAA